MKDFYMNNQLLKKMKDDYIISKKEEYPHFKSSHWDVFEENYIKTLIIQNYGTLF